MKNKGFLKIIKELNYPPIFLIPPQQFEMLEGEENRQDNRVHRGVWGLAAIYFPVITVLPTLEGKEQDNVIYHEIGHHLFPEKEHWWIDLFGEKMARGGGRGEEAARHNKTPDDIPPRSELLKMARSRSRKLKRHYRTKPLT